MYYSFFMYGFGVCLAVNYSTRARLSVLLYSRVSDVQLFLLLYSMGARLAVQHRWVSDVLFFLSFCVCFALHYCRVLYVSPLGCLSFCTVKQGLRYTTLSSSVQHGCLSCCTLQQGLRCTTLSSSVQHGCLSCCTAQMCPRHLHSGSPRLPETRILDIVTNSRNVSFCKIISKNYKETLGREISTVTLYVHTSIHHTLYTL
jgi:hypothetical protein